MTSALSVNMISENGCVYKNMSFSERKNYRISQKNDYTKMLNAKAQKKEHQYMSINLIILKNSITFKFVYN